MEALPPDSSTDKVEDYPRHPDPLVAQTVMTSWGSANQRRELAELTRFVLPQNDRSAREAAWSQLLPELQALARLVAQRFPEPIRQSVAEEGPGWLYEKLSDGLFDPDGGNFPAWATRVLMNLGLSQYRRRRRETPLAHSDEHLLAESGQKTRLSADAALEAIRERAQSLLGLLDRLDWPLSGRQQTDFFAVLLLVMRLNALQRARQALLGSKPDPNWTALPGFVAEMVPWHRHWGTRRPQANWPTLSALWSEVARGFSRPPHRCRAEHFCALVADLTDNRIQPGIDRWTKLGQRARNLGRQRMDELIPGAWDDSLASFFGERTASESSH
jgi:DNA-directed RNA polymerase specialized sigma24 family protein